MTETMSAPFDLEVLILGAGMSGLCMAIQLRRAGITDFVIVEKSAGIGGTWWDNRYPGAHVDVPAPLYSFSFAPNPRWTRRFASAPEIQRYQTGLAERHGLLPHLRLNTTLVEARFDAADGRWHCRTAEGQVLRARFFACSTGPLSVPRWPDIAGLERFAGQRLHSARWDPAAPLDGLSVGVIGTGSTASQLIAPIAARAGRLAVFQRTANWVLPRLDRSYNALDRALARVPPYAAAVRWTWKQMLELGRRGFDEGTLARAQMLRMAQRHRERQVPDPALRAKLTPDYPLGCKRLIYSNDYYPALGESHVELVTDAIVEITPAGIVTVDGREHRLDALVCATGFDVAHPLTALELIGADGHSLAAAWADTPAAYHGISVPGFPNLFMLLGPNTATGHTSTLLFIEPQVEHAIACMRAVRAGGHRSIEVRADVCTAHNADLQRRLGASVWSQCRSWYRTEGGRVFALFPGFTRDYERAVRRPDLAAYRFA